MKKNIKRVITQIRYNWRQSGNINDDMGEDYDVYYLGKDGVIGITNLTPSGGPGYIGVEFYDVEFENGNVETIYNPNMVVMEPLKHGLNCEKVSHDGAGFLHSEDDDTPYDVDGCNYCGRCHRGL